jgi:hypothetical protein
VAGASRRRDADRLAILARTDVAPDGAQLSTSGNGVGRGERLAARPVAWQVVVETSSGESTTVHRGGGVFGVRAR